MKTEAILFLLSIHEGNELRDQLPGSAYDELAAAGLLDGTDITEKGYAFVRLLGDVPEPVQTWADPRSFSKADAAWDKFFSGGAMRDRAGKVTHLRAGSDKPAMIDVDIVLKDRLPPDLREELNAAEAARGAKADIVPAGYQPNPGQIPGGVDRAADIQIVRANGKRKTLPAQTINWADAKTPDRVIGWRYAAAPGEGRIHTPGETMPAPDA